MWWLTVLARVDLLGFERQCTLRWQSLIRKIDEQNNAVQRELVANEWPANSQP
jgi:hypothetical protein